MAFEQRKRPRIAENLRAMVEIVNPEARPDDPKEEIDCTVTDLSETGICFLTRSAPPVGTELNVHLLIDQTFLGSAYVIASGEVRRVANASTEEGQEVGVEFTFIPEESLQTLKAHIKRHRPTLM